MGCLSLIAGDPFRLLSSNLAWRMQIFSVIVREVCGFCCAEGVQTDASMDIMKSCRCVGDQGGACVCVWEVKVVWRKKS